MFNISQPSVAPQIMRLVGQLLIAFADQQEGQPNGLMMPGMPGSNANPFPNGFPPEGGTMPEGLMDFLRGMGVPVPPPPTENFVPDAPGAEGLYGQEDTAAGGAYGPTPEGGHPLTDADTIHPLVPEGTILPRAFDPHDLDLDKYEDCSEKQRQQKEAGRRDTFRDDPVLWMETAIYYAHQMVDETCDVEEAARCFLTLPGGPTRRIQTATNTKVFKAYDTGWQEAQDLIQTAYDSSRLDATDFQAVMVLLGDPCSWSTRPLKAVRES